MPTEEPTVKVLVRVDCYPSRSPTVLRWLSDAFTKAGIKLLDASAGKKYLFGCWDAWFSIPATAHTAANRARLNDTLRELYQTNNPEDRPGPEPELIRGMILEWEGKDDGN